MKKGALFLICLIFSACAFCQNKSIQVELLGNSGLYSVGFENQFKKTENHTSYYRVGASYLPDSQENFLFVPLEIGRILGKGKHHFELSTGITAIYSNRNNAEKTRLAKQYIGLIWFNRIGYRFQSQEGRFIYRIGFTPLFASRFSDENVNIFRFQPWGGMSFGYVLGKKNRK